jgi:hypothetical protein
MIERYAEDVNEMEHSKELKGSYLSTAIASRFLCGGDSDFRLVW